MSKIDQYEWRGTSQDQIDFKDKVTEIINYGKFQKQVVGSLPAWKARLGEEVYYLAGGTGALMVCSADETTQWSIVNTFAL